MKKLIGLSMVVSVVLFLASLFLAYGVISIDQVQTLVNYAGKAMLAAFLLVWLFGGLWLIYKKSGTISFPDTRKKPPKRPPGADSSKSSKELSDSHIGAE